MLRADDVARYFLTHQDPDNEPITNMKLQKLCYYAQGIALVVFGAPLFHDDLEHWQHGPVVPNVFHRYKTHAQHPIPAPRNLDLELYDAPTRKLLDNVKRTYGKESASQLRKHDPRRASLEEHPRRRSHTLYRAYGPFRVVAEYL